MSHTARSQLSKIRRPVIKIGSAVLAGGNAAAGKSGPRLDRARFAALCDDVAALRQPRGKGPHLAPTVVSSGAVALGVERLELVGKPKEMALKQAAAAVGQSRLMRLWDDQFEARGLISAQVLLTHADIAHRGATKLQWSTLVRQPGRGPTLRLQTTDPNELTAEVLAAVDAVWA